MGAEVSFVCVTSAPRVAIGRGEVLRCDRKEHGWSVLLVLTGSLRGCGVVLLSEQVGRVCLVGRPPVKAGRQAGRQAHRSSPSTARARYGPSDQ